MERREESITEKLRPYTRVRDAALGIVAGGVIALTGVALRPAQAVTGDLYAPYKSPELCQPFKNPEQAKAEAEGLKAQGYVIVLAQDLPRAFKERSQGKVELIEQTNRMCFQRLGVEGKSVNEWWIRPLTKRP